MLIFPDQAVLLLAGLLLTTPTIAEWRTTTQNAEYLSIRNNTESSDGGGSESVRSKGDSDERKLNHCQNNAASHDNLPELTTDSLSLKNQSELPLYMHSKKLIYSHKKELRLTGDVHLQQGLREGFGEQLIHDFLANKTVLSGSVTLKQPGMLLQGEQMEFNSKETVATVNSATYRLDKNINTRFHGGANRIQYQDKTLVAERTWITTCEPNQKSWSISAERIRLQEENLWGTARHIILRVGKVPVLYLPWFRFPLSDARQSGFLLPGVSFDKTNGLDIAAPYYLNLAPNYDATITPRWLSKRGLLTSVEIRHLSEHTANEWRAGYLHKDQKNGQTSNDSRWVVAWDHEGIWENGVSTEVRFTKVSDDNYFRDFGRDLITSTQSELNQLANLGYNRKNWFVNLALKKFQVIDSSDAEPYSLLPSLNFALQSPQRTARLKWHLEGAVERFDRPDKQFTGIDALVGERVWFEPRIKYDLAATYGSLSIDAAWRYRRYDLTDQTNNNQSTTDIKSGLFGLAGRLLFDRKGRNHIQTLEPQFYYLWSEEAQGQQSLPLFDSARQTFSFEQLFRENRFSGRDRISDSNQLSLGLTSNWSRFGSGTGSGTGLGTGLGTGSGTGLGNRWMQMRLGTSLFFKTPKVTLREPAQNNRKWSPLAVGFSFYPSQKLTFDTNWIYDAPETQTSELAVRLQLKQADDKLFNLSYRNQGKLEQTGVSAYWPLSDRFHFAGAWRYDLVTKKNLEVLAGIEYQGCCWHVRVAWQSFLASDGRGDTEKDEGLFFQVTLKGLGNLRGAGGDIYENSIDGYRERKLW